MQAEAALYQIDDGTPNSVLGAPAGHSLMVMTSYQEQPNAQVITSIGGLWGSGAEGNTVTLMLYEDPDDDGDPDDAVLLTSVNTTAGLLSDFSVPITPTEISGWFFVALLYDTPTGFTAAGALDTDTQLARSWAALSDAGTFDINDLTNNDDPIQPLASLFPGAGNGTVMLRAVGVVPEPSTALLLSMGGLLLWAGRRRLQRRHLLARR
jgi:hypothetical protein